MVYKEGAQMGTIEENEGKTVKFSRFAPKATTPTPLTEANNPAETALTPETVTATLAEYGDRSTISRFATLTGIDKGNNQKIDVQGKQMGRTLDQLARDEMFTGATVQLAGGKAALSDIAASNTMTVAEIRKAIRTLEVNNAQEYDDISADWILKVGPYTKFDLQGDSQWVDASKYRDNDRRLMTGEIGEIFGTKVLKTKQQKTEASTVTVYSNFMHGADAFGCYDLSGDKPKLYIIPHTQVDSNNPTGAYSIVAWRGSYVVKTLNANWLINIKTGATA